MTESLKNNFYRHVDGGIYVFISNARYSVDESAVVVYEHLWPFDPGVWVRPHSEFERRFTAISEEEARSAMEVDRTAAQTAVKRAKAERRAEEQKG